MKQLETCSHLRLMRLAYTANNILLIIAVVWVPECGTRHRKHAKNMWVVTPPPKPKRRFDQTLPPEQPSDYNSSENILINEDDEDKSQSKFWASMMVAESAANMGPIGTGPQKIRACYLIATTYMSSLKDLKRYFNIRYFYENNADYEVGYMVNEIITKYQRMLELFYIVQKRFFYHQNRNFAPPTYMIYMYTTVLEMATVIGHLCNMLHEIEEKYKKAPKSGFDDYHLERKLKWNPNISQERQRALDTYQKMMAHEKKKRERARKKLRKKNLYFGFSPTTPSRTPRQVKRWPLHYGWSIEDW